MKLYMHIYSRQINLLFSNRLMNEILTKLIYSTILTNDKLKFLTTFYILLFNKLKTKSLFLCVRMFIIRKAYI